MKVKAKVTVITIWSICLVCLMGAFRMNVSAEEGIVFHVKNQTGKAGDVVTVPVELHSGEEVGGFDIKVYYDPESMEFQELKKGDMIQDDGLFDYNHKTEEAAVKIVYVVSDTVEADGTIADLVFKLKRDYESLPIGMNLNEVIDGSEEGNAVAGQVTGTDPAYQEQAERRAAQENPVAEENRTETQGEGVQKESQGEEVYEKGVQGKEEGQKDDIENDMKEKEENIKKEYFGIAVIAVGVIVTVGFIFWKQKTMRN